MNGLRLSLMVGAVVDAGLGIPLLAAPSQLARLVGLAAPADIYCRLIGLCFLMLAAVYAHTAQDPFRYAGNVGVATAGRAAGALLFVAASLGRAAPPAFLALGLVNLVLAAAHAWLGRDLYRGPRA